MAKGEFDLDKTVQTASKKASPVYVCAAGVLILVGMNAARERLRDRAQAAAAELSSVRERLEPSSEALSEAASMRDLKRKDLERFRGELAKLTNARRELFEAGLGMQEERRLLEKQWEIVSTYLLVDTDARKIHLMRGEQSLESWPIADAPAEALGGETRSLPKESIIISKERFAHPERAKSEEVAGQLQWEPPQVGTSVRANALGEYVMFTRGPLVLHGPPKKDAEHKAFAHFCLGLSLASARKLYNSAYIGTKIVIKPQTISGLLKR
jgi:hypothetical protein